MHHDLRAIAAGVAVAGPDTLVIAGRTRTAEPAGSEPEPEAALGWLLYRYCYLRPGTPGGAPPDLWSEREFQASLARTHTGTGTWESGWSLEAVGADGQCLVRRHGVRFRTSREMVRPDGVGGPGCEVRVPTAHRHLLPGFYLLVGDERWPQADPVTVRIYWHLRSAGAPVLLAMVSRLLNQAAIPFRAKVPGSPAGYQRADAGVLYLPAHRFPQARDLLARIHAPLRHRLRDEVPMFTKRLAAGLGLAEDPGDGQSFGQHRCRIAARALWTAYQDGQTDPRSRRAAVAGAFRAEGLDPDRPFLSAGAADTYRLVVPPPRVPVDRTRGDFLRAAARIGRKLCAEAIWDAERERCNWLGRVNPSPADGAEPVAARTAALAPDLYGGLSGVALFLAELSVHTGGDALQQTARGAVRCAVGQLRTRPPGLGFYAGLTGAALAAARVEALTGSGGPDRACLPERELRELLDAGMAADRDQDDLLSGRAGAAMALLALARRPGWQRCRGWAIRLGEELAAGAAAYRATAGRSADAEPLLTGLSHGAAGVGLALLELHAATGRADFLAAGRTALAYEDRLYDADARNWPDLRRGERGFMTAWCHGAPGIALARLRAAALDPARREQYAAQAEAALATTRQALERMPPLAERDATPCHGTAGLLEALLVGASVLGQPAHAATARRLAGRLLQTGVSRLRSGTLCGGPNPSLMIGLAGVGYQLLRLHDPAAVPTLLIGPCEVAGPPAQPAPTQTNAAEGSGTVASASATAGGLATAAR